MTKTVLGPAVFVVVNALLKQYGIAVLVEQEKRVLLRGNRETVDLSLPPRIWVVVVAFNLKDRA